MGNCTSSHKSASYGYQPFNRVASTATANYSYDANGNMVSKGEGLNFWRYGFDYENRLVSASTRKQTVRYRYDALGRRVQRYTVGTKENTKFIYDGQDVLVDDNAGTLTKYINGQGIDNKLRSQTGSDVNYFLADHLGSTNSLADSSGNLTASTAYDAFGNATNANFPSRYQFTGREFDNFSGLHYYRARFYDANLGRFISEDPIGFRGGNINLYGYVRNKPLKFSDPFGRDEYSMAERLGNQQPSDRSLGEMLDDLQLMLGSMGMTPGIGEPADAVDGIISLARGNYSDAALSGTSMIPFIGTGAGTTKICKRLQKLQDKFDDLTETQLLPKYREIDPDLTAGYTGSFKTGVVGNPSKPTFGQPTDLDNFDIDFFIESDTLYKQKGSGLKADSDFRDILSSTPGFEGLKPNKKGFSIKFKPSKK